jgi:hypothetical protein
MLQCSLPSTRKRLLVNAWSLLLAGKSLLLNARRLLSPRKSLLLNVWREISPGKSLLINAWRLISTGKSLLVNAGRLLLPRKRLLLSKVSLLLRIKSVVFLAGGCLFPSIPRIGAPSAARHAADHSPHFGSRFRRKNPGPHAARFATKEIPNLSLPSAERGG